MLAHTGLQKPPGWWKMLLYMERHLCPCLHLVWKTFLQITHPIGVDLLSNSLRQRLQGKSSSLSSSANLSLTYMVGATIGVITGLEKVVVLTIEVGIWEASVSLFAPCVKDISANYTSDWSWSFVKFLKAAAARQVFITFIISKLIIDIHGGGHHRCHHRSREGSSVYYWGWYMHRGNHCAIRGCRYWHSCCHWFQCWEWQRSDCLNWRHLNCIWRYHRFCFVLWTGRISSWNSCCCCQSSLVLGSSLSVSS